MQRVLFFLLVNKNLIEVFPIDFIALNSAGCANFCAKQVIVKKIILTFQSLQNAFALNYAVCANIALIILKENKYFLHGTNM